MRTADPGRHVDRERGSGTVLVLGLVAVLVVLALGVAGLARASHARATAQTAADLAALAAAADLAAGGEPGRACRVARQVTEANGAVLSRCLPMGLVVTVRAEAASSAPGGLVGAVLRGRAEARAGPVGQ